MLRNTWALSFMGRRSAGGDPYGLHAYWRLYCTDNNGGASFIEVGELDFLDANGNDIPTTGGTVIRSSVATGNNAADAFDGNASTSWLGNSTANEWIGYQYPSPVGVGKVTVTTRVGGSAPTTRAPLNCILQYSDDGSAWSDAFNFTNYLPVQGYGETYPWVGPASGYHRGWRVFCDNNNGGSSFITIDALEFRATASGADQTDGAAGSTIGNTVGRAVWSSNAVGSEGWNCFTDTGSLWHGNGTTNQWVGFIFAAAVKFEEMSITAPGSTQTRAPKDMHIQCTDDGISWTTQKDLAAQTGWAAGETRVLAAI